MQLYEMWLEVLSLKKKRKQRKQTRKNRKTCLTCLSKFGSQLKEQCHVISNCSQIKDKVMGVILHPDDLKDHHQPEYIAGKVTIGNIFCNAENS